MFANFNHRRLKDLLIGTIVGMVFVGFVQEVRADAIATMPNEGGGKIVLTDEVCKHKGTTYSTLSRAYNYTTSGHSSEGCFYIEDETVVVIWDTSAGVRRMRYPAENFTLIKKRSGTRYGT
jgi:hypothetical protein